MKSPQKRRKTKSPSKLDEREWNFSDRAKVSDAELVACCYWEYARESDFICRVAQQMMMVNQDKVTHPLVTTGKPWVQTHCLQQLETAGVKAELASLQFGARKDYSKYHKQMLEASLADPELVQAYRDLSQLYSIGTPAKLFESPKFPAVTWQALDNAEKMKWVDFVPKIPTPREFSPFQVSSDVNLLGWLNSEARSIADKKNALWQRLSEIDKGAVNLKEAAELRRKLVELDRLPGGKISALGAGGVESFMVQINWREFGDAEIIKGFAKWVKDGHARPTDPQTGELVGKRHPKQGQDPDTWRVRLEQLGIMRVRHNYPFNDDMPRPVSATKYSVKSENNREREKAVKAFHALFRFLPETEKPRHFIDFLQRK
jgi:hypothetical protein